VAVLPWRAWRRRVVADSHRTNAAGVGWTECSVAVSNQMTWRFILGQSISDLTRNPVGRNLRRRHRHRDARGRPELTGPVRVHRQTRQADNRSRTSETHARGRKAADAGERAVQKTRSRCRWKYLPLPAVFLGLRSRRKVTAGAGRHSRADAIAVNNVQCGNSFRRREVSSRVGTPFTWVRL
jgi:hypothetical protein